MADSFIALRDLYNLGFMLALEYESIRDMERIFFDFPDLPPFRSSIRRRILAALTAGPFPALGQFASRLDTRNLDNIDALIFPDERLFVRRVEYASPGFKDVAGVGEIVGHLRGFVEKIIDLCTTARQRKIENEQREAQLERMRIENAREFVSLARDCGYTEPQIRELIDWTNRKQQGLIRLVNEGKIQSAEMRDDHV